ncbi:helix-turn-helix domain-containing protein [Listeria seeligeri]|uniref:helix-turn-helix transcriptional regulator n=1 Tax=Listeria TaxID=1637 RepID=UPI00139CE395|nr:MULTISPECIES: helix-turn-helix domain-containing protein [Listeria]EDP7604088.1 helix-turn-helix domain-containing protein [Listeria monocytogenes]EEO0668555.1 helix-turn-helix domain-containing protein [Listeria monocytogenes]EEO9123661.1 helix-turn-helix domain-containing protein [Listeria monocytogenes]MBC2030596.1 helix-turn-helix domain-containing protein [Listeria seeligeri]MBC6115988.1 helix-turn-helix domain-containing protein [Listeria seeligeri]
MREKLVTLRGKRSRQDVSKDLGVTPQMLGAIERGDRTPSLKLANKIANYYNVPIEDIFFNNKETIRVYSDITDTK